MFNWNVVIPSIFKPYFIFFSYMYLYKNKLNILFFNILYLKNTLCDSSVLFLPVCPYICM